MEKIQAQLTELKSYVPQRERTNPAVSQSTVGWQIAHAILTVDVVIEGTLNSDPAKFRSSFNFRRLLILLLKRIPRGRGKSPKIVRPKAYTAESLLVHCGEVEGKLASLQQLKPNQYLDHPYFGMLNAKKTIRFIEIHTDHHLRIIRDMLKGKV